MRLDGVLMISADGRPRDGAQPLDAFRDLKIVGRVVYLWTGRVM